MIRLTRLEPSGPATSAVRVRVEGRITHQTVGQLRQATAEASLQGRRIEMDLEGVRFVDATGAQALSEARANGVALHGASHFLQALMRRQSADANDESPSEADALADQPDELSLLSRLRAGDDRAYEELTRNYGGRMLATARRLLRNEEDARDAVQEAFLSAFRGLTQFAGQSLLSTWLHRITVNAALMKLRSKSRRPEQSLDDLLPTYDERGHWATDERDWQLPGEAALQRRQTRELVRRCIDELPESYRSILILRDLEDLDNEEIATLMGLNSNVVKIRVHRARQALRTRIAKALDPGAGASAMASDAI